MIRYTKEFIQQLLDRFMNGETTMEEEDVLSEYFRQADVSAEWRDYQTMFAEWQPKEQPSHRWHWLTAAAAAVLLIVLYVAVSQRQPETSGLAKVPEPPQDTTAITPVSAPDTVATPHMQPAEKKKEPRKSNPLRRDRGRFHVPHDYLLRAQAEQQRVEQEIAEAQAEVERIQLEVLDAQLQAQGYIKLKHEDGTIEYRKENEQNEYYAYEPD